MKELQQYDLVKFIVNRFTYQSKIYKIEGGFGYVDYFEGDLIRHRRELSIPLSNLVLLSKRTKDVFTRKQLKSILNQSITL